MLLVHEWVARHLYGFGRKREPALRVNRCSEPLFIPSGMLDESAADTGWALARRDSCGCGRYL